ncbi:hypothetical protein PARPLA_01786 [Rhodobacteraceae bacterium THAF1]|uniref:hypothetical protein n=1 Tax=Palleronia sp. THAF1 TaxID=2587842 RepID=UPI000F40BECD|nr:hypothetical protein [Palleronia sp. THAF1]QFU09079.1 hypothetical protein FIU81_10375 [Palleronia sp. THAF1]VDC24120.1 hypothetical protein PARPLA_01786 [Rhodobacteraceae bacterium THAF1]
MIRRQFLTAALAAPMLATPALVRAAPGDADAPIKVRDLYTRARGFSDLARSLDGERITVAGYMAPPLKAQSSFFVLTGRPMAVCPFCESDADWIEDILPVQTKRVVDPVYYTVGIDTRGILSLSEFTDPETGFVGQMRLTDATFGR